MQKTVCCVFGHREIVETAELKARLYAIIESLILEEHVDTFLFGSKRDFNTLCYHLVTQIKGKYPHIRRVYVRAEFPDIDDACKQYLLDNYEETYYPEKLVSAGRAVYLERNREMIDQSTCCIVYCKESHSPRYRNSGTKAALLYAVRKHKKIFLLP